MAIAREQIKIGSRVRYFDIANQNGPIGQVCDKYELQLVTYHGNGSRSYKPSGTFEYEIAWEDGSFETKALTAHGWQLVE